MSLLSTYHSSSMEIMICVDCFATRFDCGGLVEVHAALGIFLRTSVSRGRLYQGVSRLEEPGFLSVLHHPQADPVLDAAAGIEVLTLGH